MSRSGLWAGRPAATRSNRRTSVAEGVTLPVQFQSGSTNSAGRSIATGTRRCVSPGPTPWFSYTVGLDRDDARGDLVLDGGAAYEGGEEILRLLRGAASEWDSEAFGDAREIELAEYGVFGVAAPNYDLPNQLKDTPPNPVRLTGVPSTPLAWAQAKAGWEGACP